jgi:DNA-binding MarR family transcriptional regulator
MIGFGGSRYDRNVTRPLGFDVIEEAHRQWSARWPAAADAMATATSVMRAQQMILSAVDGALKPFGLTFARYEALVLLTFSRKGALPLGKMGERLMIHPTSVTNIVDRLEGQRLVRRIDHPTDRRTTLCEITDAGRDAVVSATEAVVGIDLGIAGLTDRETDQLSRLLAKMRRASGDFAT